MIRIQNCFVNILDIKILENKNTDVFFKAKKFKLFNINELNVKK